MTTKIAKVIFTAVFQLKLSDYKKWSQLLTDSEIKSAIADCGIRGFKEQFEMIEKLKREKSKVKQQ